jgi:hypothetical protein
MMSGIWVPSVIIYIDMHNFEIALANIIQFDLCYSNNTNKDDILTMMFMYCSEYTYSRNDITQHI